MCFHFISQSNPGPRPAGGGSLAPPIRPPTRPIFRHLSQSPCRGGSSLTNELYVISVPAASSLLSVAVKCGVKIEMQAGVGRDGVRELDSNLTDMMDMCERPTTLPPGPTTRQKHARGARPPRTRLTFLVWTVRRLTHPPPFQPPSPLPSTPGHKKFYIPIHSFFIIIPLFLGLWCARRLSTVFPQAGHTFPADTRHHRCAGTRLHHHIFCHCDDQLEE